MPWVAGTHAATILPRSRAMSTARAVVPSPSTTDRSRKPASASPKAFVWGVWALMLLAALAYVWHFGRNAPYHDDFFLVPEMTGDKPITPSSLWSPLFDHRLPLPKLIYFSLGQWTRDYRAGMYFSVLFQGVLALALIRTAQNLRGRACYADAFFPLLLLHWGHISFLYSLMLGFVAPALLAVLFLLFIVQQRTQSSVRTAFWAGLCLLALPLCGGPGLAYVPALALWLGYVGILYWRDPKRLVQSSRLLVLGMAIAALLLVPLYFLGYERANPHADPSLREALRVSLQFMSLGLGRQMPLSFWPVSGLLVPTLLLLSTAALVVTWFKQPRDRVRTLGLFLFLGASAALALAIGWTRAAWSWEYGFQPRYVIIALPLLCGIYLTWGVFHVQAVSRLVQMGMLVLLCVALPFNTQAGIRLGEEVCTSQEALARDLQSGIPLSVLVEYHVDGVLWHDEKLFDAKELMADSLRMLSRAKIGAFPYLREDPVWTELPLSVEPTATPQATWDNGTARGSGNDSHLLFELPQPQFVCAIRLHCSYGKKTSFPVALEMFWKRSGQDTSAREGHVRLQLNKPWDERPEVQTVTVWVDETIDQFRIHPDTKPWVLHISEIVLLVPAGRDHLAASKPYGPDTPVDVLLGKRGRERLAVSLRQRRYDGRGYDWEQYAAWGRELMTTGRVQAPPLGPTPSAPLSAHYRCVHCHNLAREDVKLTVQDPEEREKLLRRAASPEPAKRDGSVLFLATGTTLWGAVNREQFYNGHYTGYRELEVTDGRKMNPRSLADAIHVCCSYCSVGRPPERWELDSLLAYHWELELRLKDLDLPEATLRQLLHQLSGRDPQAVEQARHLVRQFYLRSAGAHLGELPKAAKDDSDRYADGTTQLGDSARGHLLYSSACAACHGTAIHPRAGAELLTTHYRFNQSVLRGSERGPVYMPLFSAERLSRRQLADMRAYLRSLAKDQP